ARLKLHRWRSCFIGCADTCGVPQAMGRLPMLRSMATPLPAQPAVGFSRYARVMVQFTVGMTRARQRLLVASGILGLALKFGVVVTDAAGLFDSLENWLYDVRARRCQFFAPPPTSKLVHLDIDDKALESIGEWPW